MIEKTLVESLLEEVHRPTNSALGITPGARDLCKRAAKRITALEGRLKVLEEGSYKARKSPYDAFYE